ncbi:hypothetical protein QJQ45_007451 [Haematococcus lacustris]|nr:hypothetical protein QJQ45_007451 [Haematococcus lacustris]
MCLRRKEEEEEDYRTLSFDSRAAMDRFVVHGISGDDAAKNLLRSKNKPKPAPTTQVTPTPTRNKARLVCNTSSNANSNSVINNIGDNSSSDASNEEWVAGAAAEVAGRTRSVAGVAGQSGAATWVAGRTKSATGAFALAKAAAWVTARARKFQCS